MQNDPIKQRATNYVHIRNDTIHNKNYQNI